MPFPAWLSGLEVTGLEKLTMRIDRYIQVSIKAAENLYLLSEEYVKIWACLGLSNSEIFQHVERRADSLLRVMKNVSVKLADMCREEYLDLF